MNLKNKYYENASKKLLDMYQIDVLEDILLGREDRIYLYADLTEKTDILLHVIAGSLTKVGYQEVENIPLNFFFEHFDYDNKYGEVSGKEHYFHQIRDAIYRFNTVPEVTFPIRIDGRRIWNSWNIFSVKDNPKLRFFILSEITDLMNHEELIFEKSHKDSLTNLFNKFTLDYHYGKRYRNPDFHVLYLDLDDFKNINDSCGHVSGDHCLQAFAHILKEYETDNNRFYRLGGDEFIGMFFESQAQIIHMCEEILEKTRGLSVLGQTNRMTVSIGVVKAVECIDVIRKADDIMYEVKKSGKNAYKYVEER